MSEHDDTPHENPHILGDLYAEKAKAWLISQGLPVPIREGLPEAASRRTRAHRNSARMERFAAKKALAALLALAAESQPQPS